MNEKIINDKNRIINDSSTINGTASYAEHGNNALKSDKGEYQSSVKEEAKHHEYNRNSEKSEAVKQRNYENGMHVKTEQNYRNESGKLTTITTNHTSPERTAGSQKLSGAAATANYVSTTDKVIHDKKHVGVDNIRTSLESNVKESLILNNKGNSSSGTVAISETEKAKARADAAKGKRGNTSKEETPKEGKPASESQAYLDMKAQKDKSKGFVKRFAGHAVRASESAAAQGGKEGSLSERTAGQSMKYMLRAPRYTRNVYKVAAGTVVNIRFASKVFKDVKGGALTAKEASLSLLKRGGITLKNTGIGTIKTMGKTASEFHGSDDLGIQAVKKPKDVIVGTSRGLKVTSRAAKAVKNAPKNAKRTLRSIQKSAQTAKLAAQYAAQGVKLGAKLLLNPVVLKAIAIIIAVVLVILLLVAGVSAVAALFSSFTYQARDGELTDVYAYVTELDIDMAVDIRNTRNKPEWNYIDDFQITQDVPKTNPVPIISYLTVKYHDFKLGDVKAEIERIHKELNHVNYRTWQTTSTSTTTNKDGSTSTSTTTTDHLEVSLTTRSFEDYVKDHKDELFATTDEFQEYKTYSDIGGTTLRAELAKPFLKDKVSVSSRFGWRIDPVYDDKRFHDGIDIPMPSGTEINATMDGTVSTGIDDVAGNYVVITSDKRKTTYCHCDTVLVTDGQVVKQGDVIAKVGNTGKSTGSHLHLSFEKDGKKLNPRFYIGKDQFSETE
ncbi:MAG: M23 family metallopeptidase [Clostridiaceae bacterium]|nr:M23 family metallopeptidase [Clostridiaceae bacterium]